MFDFGYDVADYCDVAKIFGDLSQFDALLDDVHRCGLKVLLAASEVRMFLQPHVFNTPLPSSSAGLNTLIAN